VTIDSLAAQVQTILATIGIGPVGLLSLLRSMAGTPGIAELTPGSPFLVATNNTGPVAGVAYHTFGGTSTGAVGIWADTYTPDSGLPLPVPFPVFHWGSVPIRLGVVPDAVSFGPVALLAPTPEILTLASLVATLAATTPELAAGFGDVFVTDTSSRLPFAATHTTNPLNHAEALYDRGLQAQVVALLARRRTTQSGRADVRLTPFPASLAPAPHTGTATDAESGMPITAGLVSVYDADGNLALQQAIGAPFTYGFAPIRTRVRDPETRRWITEVRGPSIDVALPAPYGTLVVVTGRA
jgi:hypothetical protein